MLKMRLWFGLICLCLVGLSLGSCQLTPSQPVETITIALPALEQNALIYIADAQGLFKQNGLKVSFQDYDSGVTALNALLKGEAELAIASEFPVTRALMNNQPVRIMASLDKFENDFIVCRKDQGIEQISDLKGKRIGVTLQSINEFYLARFLELNRLPTNSVTLVDLKPAEFVQAISSGQVDAIIAWEPYISQIAKTVDGVVIWPAQSDQLVYGLLISRRDWLQAHPETATRFLKALFAAEDFTLHYPEEAKTIVVKRLKYEDAYVDKVWPEHAFGLSLDNSLIVAMTDEARWLVKNGLSMETKNASFYDVFYLDGLKAVKPEAVEINQ